uniref:Tudor domain-containing protein n=1 Tax=Clytia hemisphaerica TaxID=252671 RepID=A0A7M5WYX1_9CNID
MNENINSNRPSCSVAVRGMLLSELAAKPFPDEQEFSICVTEVVSPHLFYGQLLTEESVESIQKLTIELANVYSSEPATSFTPKINEICVAKFMDGQWYRASVIQYNSDMTAHVFFFDFGNKCDVETSDIRCIKQHLLAYPRMAQKYSLANIESTKGSWGQESIAMMSTCQNNMVNATCVNIKVDLMECSLKMDGDAQSMEEKLIQKGLARVKSGRNAGDMKIDLPTDDSFTVIVMHVKDTSSFHGQLLTSENIEEITLLSSQLSELSSAPKSDITLKKDAICAAFHQEFQEWYRVQILDPTPQNGKVLLKLLDYGDELMIDTSQLRQLPSLLFDVPVKAIPMTLNGAKVDPNCTNYQQCVEKLNKLILQKKCEIEVVNRESNRLHVKLSSDGIDCHQHLSEFLIANPIGCQIVEQASKPVMIEDVPLVSTADSGDFLVTNIEDPSQIHGQLVVNIEEISHLDIISADLTERFLNKTDEYQPKIGEICAAFFATFSQYFRAVVREINNDKTVVVQYIDYGNGSTVPFSQIAPLPKEHSTTPRQAVQFSLFSEAGKVPWTKEFIEELKEILLNKIASYKTTKKEGEILVVELSTENMNVNQMFSKYLVKDEKPAQQIKAPVTQALNSIMIEDVPLVSTADSGDFLVTNIEDPSQIHGQLVVNIEEISHLDIISADLTERFLNKTDEYQPKVGEICAAYFATFSQYFRAIVREINNDKTAVVQYIDYGNGSTVPFSQIVALPKEHSTTPRQAVQFSLFSEAGKVPWTKDCIDELKEILLNKIASYKTTKKEGGIVVAELSTENMNVNQIFSKYLVRDEKPAPPLTSEASQHAQQPITDTESPVSNSVTTTHSQSVDQYTKKPAFAVPDRCDVTIQHIENAQLFYAQENTQEKYGQLSMLTQAMTDHCSVDTTPYQPTVGDLCCGLFEGIWSRCHVIKTHANEATIFFIDFGNTSMLPFGSLRRMAPQFIQLPSFAMTLKLSRSQVASNVTEKFIKMALNEVYEMKVLERNQNVLTVQLFDRQTGDDIEDYLPEPIKDPVEPQKVKEEPKTIPTPVPRPDQAQTKPPQTIERIMIESIPKCNVPDKGQMAVVNIEGPDCIHIQLLVTNFEEIGQLDAMSLELTNKFKETDVSYQPIINEVCAAYFAGFDQYFRSVVTEVDSTKKTAKVQSLDFGNSATACFDDLAQLPMEHTLIAKQAIHFSLHGLTNDIWKKELDSELQTLLLNKLSTFKVVSRKEDSYVVEIEAEYGESTVNVSQFFLEKVQPKPPKTAPSQPTESLRKPDAPVEQKSNPEPVIQHPPSEPVISKPSIPEPVIQTLQEPVISNPAPKPSILESEPPIAEPVKITQELPETDVPLPKPSATIAPYEPYSPLSTPPPVSNTETPPIQNLTITESQNRPTTPTTVSSISVTSSVTSSPSSANKSTLPSSIHPLESAAMKIDLRDLSGGTYELKITHVESPYMIYANFKDRIVTKELNDLCVLMASTYANDSSVSNLKPGSLCAVKVKELWMRGLVTGMDEESNYSIFLIDFGNSIAAPKNEAKALSPEFRRVPAQVVPLKLITVKPVEEQEEWSNEVCQFLKEFIIGQNVRVKPEYKDGIIFGARIKVQDQPLDKLLSDSGYAVKVDPIIPSDSHTQNKKDPRKAIPFSDISKQIDVEQPTMEDFEAYVTCVVSPRLFYCRMLDDEKEKAVDEVSAGLKAHFEGKESEGFEYSEGDLCAIKLTDGQWYRGFIVRLHSNETASIWLCDFGSKYTMQREEIYPLPDKFKELPAQSVTLQMQYLVPINDTGYPKEASDYFRLLVVNRILKVKILKKHQTIYRVALFDKKTGTDVGEKYVNKGYAKYIFNRKPVYPETKVAPLMPPEPRPIHHHKRPQEDDSIHRPQESNPYLEDPYSKYQQDAYHHKNQYSHQQYPSTRGRQMNNGRGVHFNSNNTQTRGGMGRGFFKYPQGNHVNERYQLRNNSNERYSPNKNYNHSPNRSNASRPPHQSPPTMNGNSPHRPAYSTSKYPPNNYYHQNQKPTRPHYDSSEETANDPYSQPANYKEPYQQRPIRRMNYPQHDPYDEIPSHFQHQQHNTRGGRGAMRGSYRGRGALRGAHF